LFYIYDYFYFLKTTYFVRVIFSWFWLTLFFSSTRARCASKEELSKTTCFLREIEMVNFLLQSRPPIRAFATRESRMLRLGCAYLALRGDYSLDPQEKAIDGGATGNRLSAAACVAA